MSGAEDFMNRLTDMDSGWWPFLHLRPAKDRQMDNKILMTMTAYYGPFYGLLFAIVEALVTQRFSVPAFAIWIVFLCAFFFFGYKFTFAIYWNRRARRLQITSATST